MNQLEKRGTAMEEREGMLSLLQVCEGDGGEGRGERGEGRGERGEGRYSYPPFAQLLTEISGISITFPFFLISNDRTASRRILRPPAFSYLRRPFSNLLFFSTSNGTVVIKIKIYNKGSIIYNEVELKCSRKISFLNSNYRNIY
jgi:hypothetical protein